MLSWYRDTHSNGSPCRRASVVNEALKPRTIEARLCAWGLKPFLCRNNLFVASSVAALSLILIEQNTQPHLTPREGITTAQFDIDGHILFEIVTAAYLSANAQSCGP